MKKFILLLFLAISFSNCSTDADNAIDTQLQGTWSWITSSGGITGGTQTPESTGNTIKLEISDSLIKKYINGSLESELSYSIELGESVIFGEQREMIVYENQFRQSIILNGNTLTLYDECNDCFLNEYERE